MLPTFAPQPTDHLHFVTGRLAAPALREIVDKLSAQHGFAYSIGVMPITVAALMTPKWLGRKFDASELAPPQESTHVIVPGYCESGIEQLTAMLKVPVLCGPNDCRALAQWFGGEPLADDFGKHNIKIIAEINHAPRMTLDEVLQCAAALQADGADVIDFGCDPTARFDRVGEYVTALVDAGHVVSVDTFDSWEAKQATAAGASLVLSVNSTNREQAVDWGSEVVVIPDAIDDEASLHETIDFLAQNGVAMRLDPILEPIGSGFAASLKRYLDCRQRYPDLEMMMGIGNLTELTDVDSAGVNLLLLGICQELKIHSVLTTQVINWARSSVRECDVARQLTHYAVQHGIPPKRLSDKLVMLRDARLTPHPDAMFQSLEDSLKDNNYRLFAQDDEIHLLAAKLHLSESDPFALFDRLMSEEISSNVDPGHAFYLGYEMAKASIALTLGKQYEQDQALDWGMLTKDEDLHRIKRTSRHRK
jgi:dihydropteroate synthase-like protein